MTQVQLEFSFYGLDSGLDMEIHDWTRTWCQVLRNVLDLNASSFSCTKTNFIIYWHASKPVVPAICLHR